MFGSTLINSNSNNGGYSSGLRIAKAVDNNTATIMLGVPQNSLSGINPNAGEWYITSNAGNNLIISDESSNESTGLVIRGDGNLPTWKGTSLASVNSNVASATKLATARTIALGTGATGTASAFDGTANITIPVTAVNATYLLSGTVAPARLSGTYAIGISGKAATAGAADTATSASSATKLSTARSLNVTGAATGTAATFDGTGNANIEVTKLDPAKLMTVGQTVGTRHNAVAFNSGQSGATGTIKITIPGTGINTMMNIEIDVYEYNANSASKIIVGGYAYSNGPSWVNASATVLGNYNKGVRLAYNGTNFSILLGTTSTVWSYPKVMVTKVTAGHNNVDKVVSGEWTAFLVTDESDITWSATPTQTAAQSATKLAAARTISLGTGATGTATAFDGTANITIPITALNAGYLSAGTIPTARLSGTYAIGISGKAATAGVADTATSATSAATATNVSGGSVNATTGSFSGLLTANKGIQLNRAGGATTGINYYSPSYTSWQTIMSPAGTASGVSGNVTSPAGTYVTSWALRNIVEPSAGYGWTWEGLSSTGTTSAIVAELSSATGNFKTKGSVSADGGFSGSLTGNATTATQLAVARTIALGTGAAGTATAFDGTANITIPVTSLNAGYLSAGTIPTARLTGSYGIDISGTARYAQELTGGISSVAYAESAGSATLAPNYLPLAGGSMRAGGQIIVGGAGSDFNYNGGIQLRETNYVGVGGADWATAPKINFHWGNRAVTSIALGTLGDLYKLRQDGSYAQLVDTSNIGSLAAGNITTPSGTYKHLGAWGVGRTAAGAILVNTAYTADRASYADSAGSVSGAAIITGASSGNPGYISFSNGFKIVYGNVWVPRMQMRTVYFPVGFGSYAPSIGTTGTVRLTGIGSNYITFRANDEAGNGNFIITGY